MSRIIWLSGIIFIFIAILFACQSGGASYECEDAIGCVEIAPDEPLKLGVLQTLSGGSRPAGFEQVRSIKLALAERDDTFLDHPIELQIEDEKCSPEGGANAALRVIADPQVVAILGTNCSGAAVTAGEIMSNAGLVMISSSNTAPGLTAIGSTQGTHWQPGYFRTIYSDAETGVVAATFAHEGLNLRRAAIVNDGNNVYTQELTAMFAQAFEALGGTLVAEVTIDVEETIFQPALVAILNAQADVIFFPIGQPELAGLFVLQARTMPELQQTVLISGEGAISDIFITVVGETGIGTYMVGPHEIESAAHDALHARYEAAYGEAPPSFYHTFTYDATNLLLDTLEAITVREANGTLHIGRQALRDALYATRNFKGVTGNLTCTEYGDCGATRRHVIRLDDPSQGVEALQANVVYIAEP